MNRSTIFRYAFSVGASAALLSGCALRSAPDDMQPAAGAGAIPFADRSPQTSGSSALFVVGDAPYGPYVVSYPGGKFEETLNRDRAGEHQLCTDPVNGNLYLQTENGVDYAAVEYAPGNRNPIAEIPNKASQSTACAVDPTTGNLALAFVDSPSSPWIAVYPKGSGTPQKYADSTIESFSYCGYDGSGNLFAWGYSKNDPFILVELPRGGSKFVHIYITAKVGGPIEWDGSYITMLSPGKNSITENVDRISVSGSKATVAGRTELNTGEKPTAYWIQGDTVLTGSRNAFGTIRLFHYPMGGQPYSFIRNYQNGRGVKPVYSIVVSRW